MDPEARSIRRTGQLASPLGTLAISWEGDRVLGIELDPFSAGADETVPASEGQAAVPAQIREALEAYFQDGRQGIDLALAPRGTPFQQRVWRVLRTIPPGRLLTYGDLARQLGTSARAIGGACRANPCLIAVPCHRVVARDGLGGFAGDRSGRRLAVKRWLLRHEGACLPSEAIAEETEVELQAPEEKSGHDVG